MEDDRKAKPEQPDEGGFAEGSEREPKEDAEVLPDFARGERTKPQSHVSPRFSEGIEAEPEDRGDEGTFATGSDETQKDR